uniref:DUF4220 domain-containing protein n=1 Tax=Macrostomum lignano TaxID=282301 RepID=A0A1I8FKR4_9PLAT
MREGIVKVCFAGVVAFASAWSTSAQYVTKWLNEVYRLHLEIVLSVLLPHPPDYARVGGYWRASAGLLSLVQYDCIITFDVWNYTMPFWLEAIRTEVPPEELPRLSMLFNFAAERFDQTTVAVQDQLLPMFRKGVESLLNPGAAARCRCCGRRRAGRRSRREHRPDDAAAGATGGSAPAARPQRHSPGPPPPRPPRPATGSRPCFIEMLRISLQHLPAVARGWDLNNETSKQLMGLLLLMLSGVWDGKSNSCRNAGTLRRCGLPVLRASAASGTSMAACVLKFIAPAKPKRAARVKDLPEVTPQQPPTSQASGYVGRSTLVENFRSRRRRPRQLLKASVTVLTSASAPGGASGSGGAAASTSAASTSAGSGRGAGSGGAAPPSWEAFPMDENCLPEEDETKADDEPSGSADDQQEPRLPMLIWLCTCVWFGLCSSYLCLHCHALYKAQEENKDFVQFVLKYQFIPTLWKLLKAENSALAGGLVSLLLHCLALHSGAEVFWSILERELHQRQLAHPL